ncbi:MAG: TIGR04211 family SH3 domain-containing protein [Deltaproteobacteria bacterium]|nr:TIGR04211 family SH3 domain-containing protein [Deltaproteobacteria bacterium]
MKKPFFHFTLFVMTICLFPTLSYARTGYVSDMLLLTFRQGPGNSYAVTKTLKSNTPVSILDEKNGFYKVELESKKIGWVDKKFIIFELPKSFIINKLKQENKTLENKILKSESTTQALKGKIASLESEYSKKINSLDASLKKALDEKAELNKLLSGALEKYNTLIEQSKNIRQIVQKNKMLRKTNEILSKDLEIFKGKNKTLFKTGMIKWFLAGVGVLLLGWIIGQSVSLKRRRSSLLD